MPFPKIIMKSKEEQMANPSCPQEEHIARSSGLNGNRLKYAYDAGFIPGDIPPDDDTSVSQGSSVFNSEPDCYCRTALNNLASSLRLFCESMVMIEQEEMETAKVWEASRAEAKRRQGEAELELTRMTAQTQLQIARVVAAGRSDRGRKRKRGAERKGTPTVPTIKRKGAVLLSLLQSNLFM